MRKSSVNATSPFCNHLSVIPIRLACKRCTYWNIWEISRCEQFGGWKKNWVNLTTSAFMLVVQTTANESFHVVERTKTVAKWKKKNKNAHARRAKLQILTAYICKLTAFFSIAVVVAWALFISLQFFFLVIRLLLGQHFNKRTLIKRISILLFLHFWSLTKSVSS